MNNLLLLLPEFVLIFFLVFLLIKEILKTGKDSKQKPGWNTALIGAVITCASIIPFAGGTSSGFGGIFVLDPLASFFKLFFGGVLIILIAMSREFFNLRSIEKPGEFLLILWTSVIGLFFLVSANDLMLIFIALETFTLSLYIMAAYLKHDLISIEAGLKYLIIGSLASAFMIYGISLVYIASGSTALPAIRQALHLDPHNRFMLLGILFILSGLGFKVASVPFQLWVPDVYEGAPTPVVSYLAVASKAAGFALLARLLFTAFPDFASRGLLISTLAAMTLVYGNLGALVQTNIKRLFGYSSIGHAGYLLIAIAAGTEKSLTGLFYYLIAYAVSNLAAFFVITLAGSHLESDQITAYRGLAKRCPLLAGSLFIALLSLAGVPPLAGFFGKFLVLFSAVDAGMSWLTLLGLLGVAVSLYYYLSLVKTMYFEEPSDSGIFQLSGTSNLILIFLAAAILIVGIFQSPFYGFALQAAQSLF